MFKINVVMDDYFEKRVNIKKGYKIGLLYSKYKDIVGDIVAKNTRLVKVANETIYIVCRNSLWMNELINMQDIIINRFNEEVGYEAFSKVFLRVGNIALPVQEAKIELNMEDKAWIDKLISEIQQPDIRDSFKRLLETYKIYIKRNIRKNR